MRGPTRYPLQENAFTCVRSEVVFPSGSIENPLRYLFGPGPDEKMCLALTPECMGLLPYLAARFGLGS